MGCGWGGTLRKPHERPWSRPAVTRTESLLIGLFRAFAWRIVFALASPVTPEVAGSSPVAPVSLFALQMTCLLSREAHSGRTRAANGQQSHPWGNDKIPVKHQVGFFH